MPGEGPPAPLPDGPGPGRRPAAPGWRAGRSRRGGWAASSGRGCGAGGGRRSPALSAAVVVAVLGGLIGTGLGLLAALHSRRDALDREQDALKAQANEREQTKLVKQRYMTSG